MKPISSTDTPALSFDESLGEVSKKFRAPTNKVGWLHARSPAPGMTFDILVKDALGRKVFERRNCMTETDRYGELINLNMRMGEEYDVLVENVKGQKKFDILLN